MNTSFQDFINYCLSFYGSGGLYDQNRSKEQVAYATMLYLDAIAHYDSEVFTWGDGDSLDRERVRDIMNNVYDGKYDPFDYLEEKEVYA